VTLAELPSQRPADGVFRPDQAATLLESDREHWWFDCKARIVSAVLADVLPSGLRGPLVDVGAGAAGVTARLRWPYGPSIGIEGAAASAAEGRRRHGLALLAGTVDNLPLHAGTAAVVTLLDVIEHLEDPVPALLEARRVLMPGGVVLVTAPAHAWLWSEADRFLGHHRRYTRQMVRRDLERAGFQVLFATHMFSWLVLPVLLQRRLARSTEQQLGLQATSPALASIASRLSGAESRVLRHVRLPAGTSVLAVGHVPGAERIEAL